MPRMIYERGRWPEQFRQPPRARIMLATPVTDGKPCDVYTAQLASTALALAASGIAMDYCIESYNCHVDDARNSIVRQFIATDCTDLVFVDADVGWTPDDLVKLAGYDRDIVAGIYPKKQDTEDYPVYLLPKPELRAEPDGLLEVARVPTGFLRIRRPVIEQLLELTAPRAFQGSNYREGDALYHPIFERSIREGKRWSGDYEFCNKAREAGFKIHIDPEMSFSHSGGERIWVGCVGDHWRRINKLTHPDFDAAIAAIRKGPVTAEHLANLVRHWGNPWAASPLLLGAVHEAVRTMPSGKAVLEAGSGLTTLVMAAAAEQSGAQVIALEHDVLWRDKTHDLLQSYGLKKAQVIYAPLDKSVFASKPDHYWYQPPDEISEEIMDISYGLVLIDGPPRDYQARDHIHEVLATQIASAHWFMDDADDLSERAAFEARAKAAGRSVEILGKPGSSQFAVAAAPKR